MVLRYKDIYAFDNIKIMKTIYSMYKAGEVSVLRAGYPTILAWRGRYDLSRPMTSRCYTRCPRMVTEYLLTLSMLMKMYKFTISGYVPVYVHCIYSQSISCRRSLSLFSLWFCLTKQFYQILICSISACSQHQYLLSWLNFSCVYDLTCRKKEQKKEKEKEPFFSNRELLSTRKHWTINPSLAQAHHRHYRHIAFTDFQLKISTPFRKFIQKKNTLHSIAFLFCFNLFQISLQFFMCKNNGEMVWHEVTRRSRYNALKLSCMRTKYVFWSPIFPPQTTKLPPPNRSLSST